MTRCKKSTLCACDGVVLEVRLLDVCLNEGTNSLMGFCGR